MYLNHRFVGKKTSSAHCLSRDGVQTHNSTFQSICPHRLISCLVSAPSVVLPIKCGEKGEVITVSLPGVKYSEMFYGFVENINNHLQTFFVIKNEILIVIQRFRNDHTLNHSYAQKLCACKCCLITSLDLFTKFTNMLIIR